MSKTIALAAALFAASVATASAQQGKPAAKPPEKKEEKAKPEKVFPMKTSWVAVSVNGKPAGAGPQRPTFFLDDNLRANGFGGCNTYSVTLYPLRQNKLGVGPIALTRRACDKETMEREKEFLLNLRSSQDWDSEEGALIFKGARGAIRFERVL